MITRYMGDVPKRDLKEGKKMHFEPNQSCMVLSTICLLAVHGCLFSNTSSVIETHRHINSDFDLVSLSHKGRYRHPPPAPPFFY